MMQMPLVHGVICGPMVKNVVLMKVGPQSMWQAPATIGIIHPLLHCAGAVAKEVIPAHLLEGTRTTMSC